MKGASVKLKRLLAILLLPFIAMLILAGCATPSSNNNSDDKDDDKDSSDVEESEEDEDDNSDAPADGELAEPGTRVGIDEWLTHSFTNTDEGTALIASRLTSVEEVSDSQMEFLNATFDEGELEGYTVWMLKVEEKKVSGDTVEFNSDYSYYDVVDNDGDQVQAITLIGWDECKTPSFDEEFDVNGGTIEICLLGASPEGDSGQPAGVAYTGGYEDDNPYDSYDGKPLLFIKD